MKKIFLTAAIAAVAATSCTKSEELDIRQDAATDGIVFNAYTNGATKAEDITTKNVTDETFLIQAYLTNNVYASASTLEEHFLGTNHEALVFGQSNTNATKSSWYTKSTYGTGSPTIYFWPTSDTEYLSFFATNSYEYTADGALSGGLEKPEAASYPSFNYTVSETATKYGMQDLLVASTIDGQQGAVSLNFFHALAKLNFKAQGASDGGWGVTDTTQDTDGEVTYEEGNLDYKYTVRSIKVAGLKYEGTFAYDATSTVGGDWTAKTATEEQTYDYDITGISDPSGINTASIPLATGDNSLLVMPQSDTEFTVTVDYYVTYDGLIIYPLKDGNIAYDNVDDIAAGAGAKSMTITLGDSTFKLAANSQTSLTLVLPSPGDLLTYKVDVNEWDDEAGYAVEDDNDDDVYDVKPIVVTTAESGDNTVTTTTETYADFTRVTVETAVTADESFVSKVVTTTTTGEDLDGVVGAVKSVEVVTYSSATEVDTTVVTYYDSLDADITPVVGA